MGQYAIFSEDIDEIEEQLHNTDDPDYPFHDWRELDNLRYISLSKGIYGIALWNNLWSNKYYFTRQQYYCWRL